MKGMKKARLWLGLSCVAFLVSLAAFAAEVPVTALVSNPAKFDNQAVTLHGTALMVRATTSSRGNAYTTFQVNDATGAAVRVFTWGHPGFKDGQSVEVVGVFQRVKRVGRYTFYNEVEAQSVRSLSR